MGGWWSWRTGCRWRSYRMSRGRRSCRMGGGWSPRRGGTPAAFDRRPISGDQRRGGPSFARCWPSSRARRIARRDHGWMTNGRRRHRSAGKGRAPRGVRGGVRNPRRTSQRLGIDVNDMVRHGLAAAEDVRRYGSGCYIAILVMDLVDVPDVQDVGDVRNIADVCDIDALKILDAVVIPRKKRLAGTEWKPGSQFGADTDAKSE